jgi:hypothetical protein
MTVISEANCLKKDLLFSYFALVPLSLVKIVRLVNKIAASSRARKLDYVELNRGEGASWTTNPAEVRTSVTSTNGHVDPSRHMVGQPTGLQPQGGIQ